MNFVWKTPDEADPQEGAEGSCKTRRQPTPVAPDKDGETRLEALEAPKVESGVTAPAKDEGNRACADRGPKVEFSRHRRARQDEEAGAPLNFRVSAQFRERI